MKKTILAAALVAGTMLGGAVNAAFLTGDFTVTAYNVTNLTSVESQATSANFLAADSGSLGGSDSTISSDRFVYSGALDFRVGLPNSPDPIQTISAWLGTGAGSVSGLDSVFGGSQLSSPDINNGSATTTFFQFVLQSSLGATDFSINHDDGVAVFDGDIFGVGSSLVGASVGPNSERTTEINGFDGGELSILYVATNGNPSILEVTPSPVPLPAAVWLFGSALLGVFGIARRKSGKLAA